MKKDIGMKCKLTPSIVIRSIAFWVLSASVLPFYAILALLIMKLKPQTRHMIIRSAAYYFTFLLVHVGRIKYKVVGLDNVDKSRPSIYVGNHQSAWETVALNCFLPPLVWIMKKEVFKIPFYGWAVRAMSTIAIDRSKGEDSLQQVITQGNNRFELGFSIAMFPEGTRVKPGVRKPFKYGVGKLALNLNVPVIPIAHNAGVCLPRNSFWLYPGTVDVVIGEAIYPDNDDPVLFTQKIEKWVYNELNKMGS